MTSGLASPLRNVKVVKILFLRSWAWECLGTRGTISLAAKMQYFFFFLNFSLLFSNVGRTKSPRATKAPEMWARSRWEQSSISKTQKSYRGRLLWARSPAFCPAAHLGRQDHAVPGPPPCGQQRETQKAFPPPTHPPGEASSILNNPGLANRFYRLCLHAHTHWRFQRRMFL